jgi:hypothetical protein
MISEQTSIEKIKTQLILTCINNDPESFLPFLMSSEVETDAPNKEDFYEYFKGMLNQAHDSSDGELQLKIEPPILNTEKEVISYNFYDNTHVYPRLLIEVKENNNQIYIDVLPF